MNSSMKSWKESGLNECYLGWSPENDLVVISHHYGSSLLDRLNFSGIRDHLVSFAEKFGLAPNESDWVYEHRTTHFLVRWVDYLCIRADAPSDIIAEAEKCLKKLSDYPIWDEDKYGAEQWDEISAYWDGLGIREKIDYCREAGLSSFAARGFPEEVKDDFLNNPDFG